MLWGNPSSWMVDVVISQPYLDMNSEKGWEGFPRILQSCPHPSFSAAKQDPLCSPFLTDLRADPTYGYTQRLCLEGSQGHHLSLLSNSSSSSLQTPEMSPQKQFLAWLLCLITSRQKHWALRRSIHAADVRAALNKLVTWITIIGESTWTLTRHMEALHRV